MHITRAGRIAHSPHALNHALRGMTVVLGAEAPHVRIVRLAVAGPVPVRVPERAHELLLNRVWGLDAAADYNNVEVYISFLRQKLHALGSCAAIRTIRLAGYQLEATP